MAKTRSLWRAEDFCENRLAVCIVLMVLSLLPYAQTLSHNFVSLDDAVFVYDNPYISGGFTSTGLKYSLGQLPPDSGYPHFGHPLAWWSHMVDIEVFGLNPCGHHAVNVALHVANVLLLFLLFTKLTGSTLLAAASAAIFAVHPSNVQVVAWIAQRKTLLCGVFQVACLISYVEYARAASGKRYATVTLLYVLALLAKASAVTLPCVFLLLDFWPLRRMRKEQSDQESDSVVSVSRGRIFVEKLPWFALSAGISLLAYLSQVQSGSTGRQASIPGKVVKSLDSYLIYLQKFVVPDFTGVLHPSPVAPTGWDIVVAALILGGITTVCIIRIRKTPAALIGWLWFLGTMVPVVGVVQLASQVYAIRYLYLTVPGLLLAGFGCFMSETMVTTFAGRRVLMCSMFSTVLMLLSGLTWFETGKWKDSLTLYRYSIEVEGYFWQTESLLAVALENDGQLSEAVAQYGKVLRAGDDSGAGFYVKYEEALRRLLVLEPERAQEWNDLGVLRCLLLDFEDALPYFEKAIELRPDFEQAQLNYERAKAEVLKLSGTTTD